MSLNERDAHSLFNQGVSAYRAYDLSGAIKLWTEARAVYVRLSLEKEVAICDTCIGSVYYVLGQPQQVIEHYEQARAIYVSLGFEEEVAECDNNIGAVLCEPECVNNFETPR